MELRKELEINIEVITKIYPIIKKKILDFTEFCESNSDGDVIIRHKELEQELTKMTGKNMSSFNLWEFYEYDGLENLAFKISIPSPNFICDFTKEELKEVILRIITFEKCPNQHENNDILMLIWANKSYYYRELLKVNFKRYDFKLFIRNKDKNGKYFEYSTDEILEKLWDK